MNWKAFAENINGNLQSNSTGFAIGDTVIESITREDKHETLIIEKKVRRSYGGSAHSNFEKFEYSYSISGINFGRNRIVKKSYLKRLGKRYERRYEIEGDKSDLVLSLTASKSLRYLLRYPKSELMIFKDLIKFRSESIGEMREDLGRVYDSMEMLKNILLGRSKIKTVARKVDQCKCEIPPFLYQDYDGKIIGCDKRGGEIALQKCKFCAQTWLRYYIDYNLPLIKTGRWYRGKISEDRLRYITAENAVRFLEQLDSYFYGGTYFNTLGKTGKGKLNFEI